MDRNYIRELNRVSSTKCLPYILFFLNQQFITWCTVADRGSDYIATYMQIKLTLRYKKRKGKQKKERNEKGKEDK